MPVWLSNLIVTLMTKLTSWLFAKGLEYIHGKQKQETTEDDIDLRLKKFKEAYKETFDGKPITPEQKEKLKSSIRDFIRNPNSSGM